jgi:hypothetical protein
MTRRENKRGAEWTSWIDKNGQKRTNVAVLARLIKVLAPAAVALTGKP